MDTELFLQRLFDAMGNGAIYASLGLALAIIYKSTGHLNFAQGEMAMFSAFIAYVISSEHSVPTWLAIVISMALSFLFGALVERVLIRPLERRNPLSVVIVTLGLFLVVLNMIMLWVTSALVPGFDVHGIASTLIASLVLAVVGMIWKSATAAKA